MSNIQNTQTQDLTRRDKIIGAAIVALVVIAIGTVIFGVAFFDVLHQIMYNVSNGGTD